MTIDASVPRSRRAILAGGIAGLAAVVAAAIGRPLPTRAGNGDPVTVGGTFTGTHSTRITNTTPGGHAIEGASAAGAGVWGDSGTYHGVYASSDSGAGAYAVSYSGIGVQGSSATGTGMRGISTSGTGIYGESTATTNAAIIGRSNHSTGLLGFSGSVWSDPPAVVARTGVFGYAVQDETSRGVTGQSAQGRGVNGIATTGRGVHGQATSGYGVRGYATTGTAVYAASAEPMAGYALRAVGRVRLDKCAGVATIAAAASSVVVTPGIDLVSTSAVVATLQGNAGGSTTVKRVAVDSTADSFTIHLTAASTADVKVAWHVLG